MKFHVFVEEALVTRPVYEVEADNMEDAKDHVYELGREDLAEFLVEDRVVNSDWDVIDVQGPLDVPPEGIALTPHEVTVVLEAIEQAGTRYQEVLDSCPDGESERLLNESLVNFRKVEARLRLIHNSEVVD